MKVIKKADKKIIYLEEKEIIEVKLLSKRVSSLIIMENNGSLLVENIDDKRIKQISIEQEEIEKMKTK